MTVDETLREQFVRLTAENEKRRGEPGTPLEPGTAGGDSGSMDGLAERVTRVEVRLDAVEQRLAGVETRMDRLDGRMDRLDTRMDGIDTRLRSVEQSLAAVNAKLDLLTTQIVAKLPTWWQMPAVIGSTVALLAALWAAARWLATRGIL